MTKVRHFTVLPPLVCNLRISRCSSRCCRVCLAFTVRMYSICTCICNILRMDISSTVTNYCVADWPTDVLLDAFAFWDAHIKYEIIIRRFLVCPRRGISMKNSGACYLHQEGARRGFPRDSGCLSRKELQPLHFQKDRTALGSFLSFVKK